MSIISEFYHSLDSEEKFDAYIEMVERLIELEELTIFDDERIYWTATGDKLGHC